VKKYFIAAGISMLLSIGFGFAFYLYNKPHHDTSAIKAEFSFDARDLYTEYQGNETAADKKLVDKVIEVKGTVSDMRQNDSTAEIQLNTGDPQATISCSFLLAGHKKISLPLKGLSIKIKGKCTGFLEDVNLVDCVVE
jgi:hypothetical protein